MALAAMLALSGCGSPTPENLGPQGGTLAPCPASPNCVHTGLRHPDGTDGMYLLGSVPGPELMERLRAVVESMPRTTVVQSSGNYLHAESRSLLFRFIDDLELLVAADGELVVRSASRLGKSDLGVNARRVERLGERLRGAGLIR